MKDVTEFPATDAAAIPQPSSLLASLQACAASPGHFDELRGRATPKFAPEAAPGVPDATNYVADGASFTGAWGQFFAQAQAQGGTDLKQRAAGLARQLCDNGVSHNVYADQDGSQRPASVNLFPLIIEPDSWQQIEAGVLQRMRLLERVMVDIYGPQQLLAQGLLPPALVLGNPGYLRAMHGVAPVGGNHLHTAAFDLARGPDSNWWLVSQHCQAPSGLGYLLENRQAVSSQFAPAMEALRVQHPASTYRALLDGLKKMSPAGVDSHLALLTPGPYNKHYSEHACLARYLGLTLVEGCDLLVRDERLYLKTIKGLVPVHGLLKCVDDQYLDPLELRADSSLGVAGLLQAIRAGHVLVANAPGSVVLESPALLGFLPAMCRHLLGQELQLPALPTWWCGEPSAMAQALPRLHDSVIQPTYSGSPNHVSFAGVAGRSLSARELDEWAARVRQQNEEYTVQAGVPQSQMPTWQAACAAGAATGAADGESGATGQLASRSVMLRVFAVADGPQSWRVLPGGLARVASTSADLVTLQQGGSSADVWALRRGEHDANSLPSPGPGPMAPRNQLLSSRAAENFYWLGRYTARAAHAIRLARLTLECLNGETPLTPPLLLWLGDMAQANTLVLPGVPLKLQAQRVFERALISSLASTDGATSVGYNLRALKMAASTVRERLSDAHWRAIVQAEQELFARGAAQAQGADCSAPQALRLLQMASEHMAAISGAPLDRSDRDDGWRWLDLGRQIERLGFLAASLASGINTGALHTDGGVAAMMALFDSNRSLHLQGQQGRDLGALIELWVHQRDNPHSLAWVAHTLRELLAKLTEAEPLELGAWSRRVPDPAAWRLAQWREASPDHSTPGSAADTEAPTATGGFLALDDLLRHYTAAAFAVSDEISTRYFSRAMELRQSVAGR